MPDLKPHALRNIIHWIHKAFFYGDYTQQMWSLPEETLFSHFITTLNHAFEAEDMRLWRLWEWTENLNISTSLSRAPRVYHVSTMDELSFNPTHFCQSPTTPEHHEGHSAWGYRCHSFTFCQLVFTYLDDESPVRPTDDITNTSAPMLEAQSAWEQNFHHQTATNSITATHPHTTQKNHPQILIIYHGIMIQLPLKKTFQQYHWMT